jgi:hypothetical protein
MIELADDESAKAAEAFALYVDMGPQRSLRKLCDSLGRDQTYLSQLSDWSVKYKWQDRLKQLALISIEQSMQMNTDTYVKIVHEYNRRVSDEGRRQFMALNSLHGIYDRVKPEQTSTKEQSLGSNVFIKFEFNQIAGRDE